MSLVFLVCAASVAGSKGVSLGEFFGGRGGVLVDFESLWSEETEGLELTRTDVCLCSSACLILAKSCLCLSVECGSVASADGVCACCLCVVAVELSVLLCMCVSAVCVAESLYIVKSAECGLDCCFESFVFV